MVTIFEVPEKKLSNYTTTKKDHEKSKHKRPPAVFAISGYNATKWYGKTSDAVAEPKYEKACIEDCKQMIEDSKAGLSTAAAEEIKAHI